jgi:hypothetical protein
VGFARVRGTFDPVEGELDALNPALGDDAGVELARALERPELGLAVLAAWHAFLGHTGVELEGKPGDLQVQVPVEEFYCLL